MRRTIDLDMSIDAIAIHKASLLGEADGSNDFKNGYALAHRHICELISALPSAESEQKEPCSAWEGLEDGDTLYAHSDWDGGIGFDYIRDIKYCPVCGRRLNNG